MHPARHAALSAPHGRREHRKQTTRRELLSAGRRLFGEHGLYESRIEDLARQAGIAKGTLYGYFANKEELIDAVVSSGYSELLGHAHRQAQGARTHEDVVARLAEAHFEFFEQNPDLMRLFHQVRGLLKFNRPEGRKLRLVLANYLAGLAHVLALHRPVRKGSEREQIETATVLFGAVSGIASTRAALSLPGRRTARPRSATRAVVALVLEFENRAAERVSAPAAGTTGPATPRRAARRTAATPSD